MNQDDTGLPGPGAPPVVFLMGPTASGKTALACRLHDTGAFDLVSVDAVQVYRGMEIGTGKLSGAERRRWPHHLIDIRDPARPYSAGEFCRDALALIAGIHARGRIPLLVGGTSFYFHALERGLADLPRADRHVRQELDAEARVLGWPAMHARLGGLDPAAALRIDPNDGQRIQRALELQRLGGSAARSRSRSGPRLKVAAIAWTPSDRSRLHARIQARFLAMLQAGLVEETLVLLRDHGLGPELPALRAVGYRQAAQYIAGTLDRDALAERGIAATRQLAKRQLTWLRNRPSTVWFDADHGGSTAAVLRYLTAKLPAGAL